MLNSGFFIGLILVVFQDIPDPLLVPVCGKFVVSSHVLFRLLRRL
jgi:hypothetical protein